MIQTIYIADESDARYCRIFINGCPKEEYDDFFRTTGYIENARENGVITENLPVCDSVECCKYYMILAYVT